MKQFTKTALTSIASHAARWPLRPLLPLISRPRAGDLHVLTYHRVDWPEARADLCPSTLSATPADFVAQMERLREQFHPVAMDEVRAALAGDIQLRPRSVLITFDDAYRDFSQHAWGVLRRLDLPATMFVPTAFAEQPQRVFWWDRIHQIASALPLGETLESTFGKIVIAGDGQRRAVAKRIAARLSSLPHTEALDELERLAKALAIAPPPPAVLNWRQLTTMSTDGLTLAPHTRTHPLMHRISMERARCEVQSARDDIRRHTGRTAAAFAYPGGAYNQAIVAMLAEEGFQLAFTTRRGANRIGACDPLQLRRINIGRRTTPDLLATQLLLSPPVINRLVLDGGAA